MNALRTISAIRRGHPSSDGAGVKIHRLHDFQGGLDPLLMLDELRSDKPEDYAAGFPSHPHRGIQTLTYVIRGGLSHEDHLGHRSTIHAGDAQWMHTGRGIIHSEMPVTDVRGFHAFQLWLNLPAAEKMSEPDYRDVSASSMPKLIFDGGALIALGGGWVTDRGTLAGPLTRLSHRAGVAHLELQPGAVLRLTNDSPMLAVYVYNGSLDGGPESGGLGLYGPGEEARFTGSRGLGALLIYGVPIGEPIAHYGPFVMNTEEELEETLRQYRDGTFL